jgi:hypothetical protein
MSTEDGAPPCDPQKRAAEAVEKFESKVRRRAQRLTASKTGTSVPFDKVHSDPKSCDTFQRLMEVILRAVRDHDPERGMSWEAFIDFRLAHTDADASFFEGPLTVPYGAAMDYLGAKNSSHDQDEQRADWEARGRDPLDWDTISHSQSFDQPTLPGDWTAFLGEERHDEPAEMVACAQPGTDALAEGRLFVTQDLTEVEEMVWRYHHRGFGFEKIGRDYLPDHLFDRSGNVEHKVRRIYLKAEAKAQAFRKIDGSAL